MVEWLTNWSISKAIFFVLCLIFLKPLSKMGFWIADGIGCHITLNEFAAATHNRPIGDLPQQVQESMSQLSWGRIKGFAIAPSAIILFLVLELIFVGWLIALCGLGAVIMGMISFDWSQLKRKFGKSQ